MVQSVFAIMRLLFGDLPEVQLFAGELFFNDTSCFDSRSQHVLLSGEVVWLADSVHFIEVAESKQHNSQASDMKSSLSTNTKPAASLVLRVTPPLDQSQCGLTSQQSRSVGTQQLFQSRPARQSLSTASG